jgi:tRNA pseudouridine38-40 synthase
LSRYFIEVAYKGTRYAGFQIQHNANTIQAEIENAFGTLFPFLKQTAGGRLTGSSRTDSGVHALQNFFHFDWHEKFDTQKIYNLNAILPADIVIKNIHEVSPEAHCRFDAVSRTYQYHIYKNKNPFLTHTAYFYPYPLNVDTLNEAAAIVKTRTDFTGFSKRNTQVKNFNCQLTESRWFYENDLLIYEVKGNRFLRGMVRALTATMLKVGRGIITIEEFKTVIESQNRAAAFFDAPAHGLFLMKVEFD